MEFIRIFNIGQEAAKNGLERVAPETVMYPIISRFVDYHEEECRLSDDAKREWLRGWDSYEINKAKYAAKMARFHAGLKKSA